MLSMIQETCRTQQITLQCGKARPALAVWWSTGGWCRTPDESGGCPDSRCGTSAQQRGALFVVDEHRGFVALAHLAQHSVEQGADRAGHAGMKSRVLPQQGGQQCRTGARQPGYEMDSDSASARCTDSRLRMQACRGKGSNSHFGSSGENRPPVSWPAQAGHPRLFSCEQQSVGGRPAPAMTRRGHAVAPAIMRTAEGKACRVRRGGGWGWRAA